MREGIINYITLLGFVLTAESDVLTDRESSSDICILVSGGEFLSVT